MPDLSLHISESTILIEKWVPQKPISVIYFDAERDRYYIKRFLIEQEQKEELVISESKGSELLLMVSDYRPSVTLEFVKPRGKEELPAQDVDVADFIAIKGIKAMGNQLTTQKIKQVIVNEPLEYTPEEAIDDDIDESDGSTASEDGELRLF